MGLNSGCEGRWRRVSRLRKRSEEEERAVRWNAENPKDSPIRWANRSLSMRRLLRMEAARKQSKSPASGQNHDSKRWCKPSFRTCCARNPCDSQVRRESSGDDARESGIGRTCSRRIDTMTMRLPRAAHRAKQPRANRCLRKSNGGDVVRGGSQLARWQPNLTPKSLLKHHFGWDGDPISALWPIRTALSVES